MLACCNGLPSGRGWAIGAAGYWWLQLAAVVAWVAIGAAGYRCRRVLCDVAINGCNGLPSWRVCLSVPPVAIGAAGYRRRRVLKSALLKIIRCWY